MRKLEPEKPGPWSTFIGKQLDAESITYHHRVSVILLPEEILMKSSEKLFAEALWKDRNNNKCN